jgi:hypothetical protein
MVKFRTQILASSFIAASFAGCSMSSSRDDSSIHVDLSSLRAQQQHQLALGLSASGSFLSGLTAPPSNAALFNCYGVNVTGPGIGNSGGGNDDPALIFPKLWDETSYCSYRGVVTQPINLGSTGSADVALQVPPGDLRLVQVVGVNDPLVCASGVLDDPAGSTGGGGRFFEVGRAKLVGVFGDNSVSVGMNWPTTQALQAARSMQCGSGNCTVGGNPPPVPLLITDPSITMNSGGTNIVQRLPTASGHSLKQISLTLTSTYVTAGSLPGIKIYKVLAGTDPTTTPGAAAVVDTGFTGQVAIPTPLPTAAPVIVDVPIGDGSGIPLVMASGYDYFFAMNSTSFSFMTVYYAAGAGGTETYSFGGPNSPWTSNPSSLGIYYTVQTCGP